MKSEKQRKVPNSRRNLDMSLQRLYGAGANLVQVRMAMANTIVGQMLPDVVIKGGTSLRLRYGRGASRYTKSHRNCMGFLRQGATGREI